MRVQARGRRVIFEFVPLVALQLLLLGSLLPLSVRQLIVGNLSRLGSGVVLIVVVAILLFGA